MIPGAAYGWPNDAPKHRFHPAPRRPWAAGPSHVHERCGCSSHSLLASGLSPSEGFTLYATVYGSWNTLFPVGQEILRIDVMPDDKPTLHHGDHRFAWDAGTPCRWCSIPMARCTTPSLVAAGNSSPSMRSRFVLMRFPDTHVRPVERQDR